MLLACFMSSSHQTVTRFDVRNSKYLLSRLSKLHIFRYLNAQCFALGTDNSFRFKVYLQPDFPAINFFYSSPELQLLIYWCWFKIVNFERSSEKTKSRLCFHPTTFFLVFSCSSSTGAVTIYHRSNQASVNITGNRHMIRFRPEITNRFISIPVTFYLIPLFI